MERLVLRCGGPRQIKRAPVGRGPVPRPFRRDSHTERPRAAVACAILLLAASTALTAAPRFSFEDPDERWMPLGEQVAVTVLRDAERAHTGLGCLEVAYVRRAGEPVAAVTEITRAPRVQSVRLWVQSLRPATLGLVAWDREDREFLSLFTLVGAVWQQVALNLVDLEPTDLADRTPLRPEELAVFGVMDLTPQSGAHCFWVDDVEFSAEPAPFRLQLVPYARAVPTPGEPNGLGGAGIPAREPTTPSRPPSLVLDSFELPTLRWTAPANAQAILARDNQIASDGRFSLRATYEPRREPRLELLTTTWDADLTRTAGLVFDLCADAPVRVIVTVESPDGIAFAAPVPPRQPDSAPDSWRRVELPWEAFVAEDAEVPPDPARISALSLHIGPDPETRETPAELTVWLDQVGFALED